MLRSHFHRQFGVTICCPLLRRAEKDDELAVLGQTATARVEQTLLLLEDMIGRMRLPTAATTINLTQCTSCDPTLKRLRAGPRCRSPNR